jgi:hypothetical protein
MRKMKWCLCATWILRDAGRRRIMSVIFAVHFLITKIVAQKFWYFLFTVLS